MVESTSITSGRRPLAGYARTCCQSLQRLILDDHGDLQNKMSSKSLMVFCIFFQQLKTNLSILCNSTIPYSFAAKHASTLRPISTHRVILLQYQSSISRHLQACKHDAKISLPQRYILQICMYKIECHGNQSNNRMHSPNSIIIFSVLDEYKETISKTNTHLKDRQKEIKDKLKASTEIEFLRILELESIKEGLSICRVASSKAAMIEPLSRIAMVNRILAMPMKIVDDIVSEAERLPGQEREEAVALGKITSALSEVKKQLDVPATPYVRYEVTTLRQLIYGAVPGPSVALC
jgi:hypothetical protein